MRRLLPCLLAAVLAGCGAGGPTLDADAPLPERLSELGVLRIETERLVPVDGIAYDLGAPLFSDYAWKYRTVHLPPGTTARSLGPDRTLAFPVGTVITKTFLYPEAAGRVRTTAAPALEAAEAPLDRRGRRLLETRVLVHRADGWEAVSYLWHPDGADATRARAGALLTLETMEGSTFDYLVPDANQCAGCHETAHGTRRVEPIGPKPGNLAAVAFGGTDQYGAWRTRGLVADAQPVTPWVTDGIEGVRAYLDANCAHCHSDLGAADTAGIDLRIDAPLRAVGLCKPPVAAGRGSGGLRFDVAPGRAEASILVHRLGSTDPGVMMPELGRTLVHEEGLVRVKAWIDGLEGDCGAAAVL